MSKWILLSMAFAIPLQAEWTCEDSDEKEIGMPRPFPWPEMPDELSRSIFYDTY